MPASRCQLLAEVNGLFDSDFLGKSVPRLKTFERWLANSSSNLWGCSSCLLFLFKLCFFPSGLGNNRLVAIMKHRRYVFETALEILLDSNTNLVTKCNSLLSLLFRQKVPSAISPCIKAVGRYIFCSMRVQDKAGWVPSTCCFQDLAVYIGLVVFYFPVLLSAPRFTSGNVYH